MSFLCVLTVLIFSLSTTLISDFGIVATLPYCFVCFPFYYSIRYKEYLAWGIWYSFPNIIFNYLIKLPIIADNGEHKTLTRNLYYINMCQEQFWMHRNIIQNLSEDKHELLRSSYNVTFGLHAIVNNRIWNTSVLLLYRVLDVIVLTTLSLYFS